MGSPRQSGAQAAEESLLLFLIKLLQQKQDLAAALRLFFGVVLREADGGVALEPEPY